MNSLPIIKIFFISLTIFYFIFIDGDKFRIFFIIVIITLYIYINSDFYIEEKKIQNKNVNFWKNIDSMIQDYTFVDNNIFAIHKAPKNIKFIKTNQNISNIIEKLEFLKIYQKDTYLKIIIYLEHFLKLHYNVMIDKYDACLYYSIMRDIKKELLNLMNSLYFSLPMKSNILDIKNIDEYLNKYIIEIQAITTNYISILKNKYKNNCENILNVKVQSNDIYLTNYDLYT